MNAEFSDTTASAALASEERGARSRDRVLLYVRGMDIPPMDSLDLARESLKRSGPDVDPAEAMRNLRGLLAERGLAHSLQDSQGRRQLSAPPMNRRPMIAEGMGRASCLAAVGRALKRLAGFGPRADGPGERHE